MFFARHADTLFAVGEIRAAGDFVVFRAEQGGVVAAAAPVGGAGVAVHAGGVVGAGGKGRLLPA